MWNGSVRFLRKGSAGQDKDGFRHTEDIQSDSIPASFTDVTRNDEILASQKGYTDGTVYDVKRIYRKDKSMAVILTCERRQHGEV